MINTIKKLKKEGLMLLDMHSHTRFSDASHTYEQSVEKAKREGFGICITDHNEIKGSLKIPKGVFTLYGIEVTTKDIMDILLYFSSQKSLSDFYKKYIENSKIKEFGFKLHRTLIPTSELLDYARDYNALSVIAHPQAHHPKRSYEFFNKNKENKLLLRKIHAIEGFNSMMPKNANPKAISWASELSKPIIASSDAHRLKFLGYGLTACYAETKDEFITQVLKNNSMILGREITSVEKFLESSHIVYRNIKLL